MTEPWLKITCVRKLGHTAYGAKVGRRKAPVYEDTAWVVFDKSKQVNPYDGYEQPKVVLGYFATFEEAYAFIDEERGRMRAATA